MPARNVLRSVGVVLVMMLAAVPAVGYIHFPPPTLPKLCKQSTNIRVLEVKKHDKERGIIIFGAIETLKGETPKDTLFKHAIRKDTAGTKPIFDWLADGKRAVLFTIEGSNISCGYVFIDKFCYSVDYSRGGGFWLLIRVDPDMSSCYHGSVEQLQKLAKDILDGKDVKVPVDEATKPVPLEERQKQVPALNEILIKNRG
jgi:hypothetical protein